MILELHNHGPLILGTNYWQTDQAAAGKFFCSVNAGAIRLLVPAVRRAALLLASRAANPLAAAVDVIWHVWLTGRRSPRRRPGRCRGR